MLALLKLSDSELLKLCEASSYKGSGPGGQHRNKTNSGIQLKLKVSNRDTLKFAPNWWTSAGWQNPLIGGIGVQTFSCDDRSAHVNKLLALKKLRMKIALQMREEPAAQIPFAFPGSNGKISSDNKLYPEFIADILNRINAENGDLSEAAAAWGLSKSALNKIILQDKKVLEAFQEIRSAASQKIRSAASPIPSSEDSL